MSLSWIATLEANSSKVVMLPFIYPDDIAHRASHQEVFLDEPQFPSRDDGVRWIEHLGNGFRSDLLLDGVEIVAVIEDLHVEVVGGARGIEPQAIHGSSAVTGNQHVIRNANQNFPIHPHRVITALAVGGVLDASVYGHETCLIGAGDLPGTALREPVIGPFPLVSVVDFLLEQTVFVIDAVAAGGHSERSHRIQKTGGQAAETAVAERRIEFTVLDGFKIRSQIAEGLAIQLTNPQVVKVIPQRLSHQKFNGEVVDPFGIVPLIALFGFEHLVHQPFPHR